MCLLIYVHGVVWFCCDALPIVAGKKCAEPPKGDFNVMSTSTLSVTFSKCMNNWARVIPYLDVFVDPMNFVPHLWSASI